MAELDKVVGKLSELQNKFISAVPAINKFNNSLKSISGSFSFKNIINDTIKALAEMQKMRSQSVIASVKAQ